jgi:hypothetical protein
MKIWIVFVRPPAMARYVDSIWASEEHANDRKRILTNSIAHGDYSVIVEDAAMADARLSEEKPQWSASGE